MSNGFYPDESIADASSGALPASHAEASPAQCIAIVGMSGRFPGAPDIETFWNNIVAGKDSISHFSATEIEARDSAVAEKNPDYVPARGVLEAADMFDAEFFGIPPREAERMDPQHRIFLETCWTALEDAGYDSTRYPGEIGLFAGCSLNTYLLANLCQDRAFLDELTGQYQVGDFQVFMGNDKDFLTSRVAYKLNLRGPCFSISAACATSLVAICQASQSLLNYQCSIALAGGVSATFPQKRGHVYTEGGIGSSDGVCRPFDADATGTVFSHGAGVVVLKRLEDAIADRDHITAVIHGFAVNNDGSVKAGYMAPGVQGQTDVIAAAQAMAGFAANSIGYIEAHGTATPLGDPIELAALTRAFRLSTDRREFCAIGSAKANVGHLDAAAGVTGLIKAALSLSRSVLPPLAHFKSPNPALELKNSPFYINRESRPWISGTQRRAGVSAFGVGGVNAHVVLEEAPLLEPSVASAREQQLLCLSARSEPALQTAVSNLADYLRGNPTADLGDVAYTLAVGRKTFSHRAAFVCPSPSDAASKLSLRNPLQDRQSPVAEIREVAFLFPGQGSQFVGMGAKPYLEEPFYRAQVDQCADILIDFLGRDIRKILYSVGSPSPAAQEEMQQTQFAQVSLFVTEYSLARLWQHWGVPVQAMAGHSVGEYVAAVVAEVMSLRDALQLVSLRGRLMQQMPRGGMVSVRLGEDDLQPYLGDGISIAALNAPHLSVLAGPIDQVERLESRLVKDEVGFARLRTSHAFHSAMMEPILGEFVDAVAKVGLSDPSIPYVSSLTGNWITPEEATSPAFWADQICKPVRFADALSVLMSDARILLEVGAGTTLTTLARQQPKGREAIVIPSLPHREEQSTDGNGSIQDAMKELWLAGVVPDWDRYYGQEARRRLPLPTYPFQRRRYWVDPPERPISIPAGNDVKATLPSKDTVMAQEEPSIPASQGEDRLVRSWRLQPILSELFTDLSGIDLKPEEFEHSFLELGLDSLLLTQAAQSLQKKFKVKVTLRQMMEQHGSIVRLASYLDTVLPPEAFPAPVNLVPCDTLPPPQVAPGNDLSLSSPNAMERLLHEQLATMTRVFEQQVATLKAAGSAPAAIPAALVREAPSGPVSSQSAEPPTSVAEVKHGSYRPLQARSHQELNAGQELYIRNLIAGYEKRTPGSKLLTQQSRKILADPRAVAGFRPQWKDMVYPLVTERAKGSRIWDVDGNEYVDIVNGYGAIMFGHSPEFVLEAVRERLELGVAIGPQSPLAGEVAALISELTGNERVTFCNTGSEAVMAAIRLARTVTGRDRVVYFAGDYHGTFDEVLMRRTPRGTAPIAPGIPLQNTNCIVVLEYGAEESLDYITKHADEIAAVLIEPVQTRNPALQPIEFIRTVREITARAGIALILDEVVTGFRAALGGAQQLFDVRADLVTYGKVIGGGYPIGVLSGKASFMDALDGGAWQYGDDSVPETGVTFFAGTFVRHPLALAAARSVLRHLKAEGPQLQLDLNRKTSEVAGILDDFFVQRGVPSRVHHFSSWFHFNFNHDARLGSLLYYVLRKKGIHIQEGYPCFLTTAHTQPDLDAVLSAFRESVDEMQSAGVLEKIDASASKALDSLTPALHPEALPESPREAPITESQREIYFAASLGDEANCAFNESVTIQFQGVVDERRLIKSVQAALNRHDALRSTFSEDGESIIIAPVFSGMVEYLDISQPGQDSSAASVTELVQQRVEQEGRLSFSLTKGPLARASILRTSNDEVTLIFTAHHIVLDGWSANVLLEEIAQFYNVEDPAKAKLQPLLPYSSYAIKERAAIGAGDFLENEAYWVSQFAGLAPVLNLPTDRVRPKQKSYRGATLKGNLSEALYSDLKKASARHGATLYVTLLSGFQLLLHRLTRQPEVVVGISAAGQSAYANASLVGHCVHFLPMLSQLSGTETAKDHILATRSRLFDAFDHQQYTFGSLLQKLTLPRDPARMPLIEVQFNLEKLGMQTRFQGLTAKITTNAKQFVNTDLFLNLIETEEGISFDLDFNTDLLDPATVRRWMDMYATLLEDMIRDSTKPVDKLTLLTELEKEAITSTWNKTEVDFGEFHSVCELFEQRAAEKPNCIAVECNGFAWTASELDRYANHFAQRLNHQGLQPGDLVGVCVTRSVEMLGALLGVMKAGGVYVPLDPAYPRARLEMILADAEAKWLGIDDGCPPLNTTARLLSLERGSKAEPAMAPSFAARADKLAYVIYTSGSTGRPKGVAIPHGALTNLLRSMERRPGLDAADVFVAVTTISFDIAGLELFLPLITGARLIIATEQQASDGFELLALLKASRATVLQATPGTWRMLLDAGWDSSLPLKVLCGGEALPRQLADDLLQRGAEVWNMYGPTETTIWSSPTFVGAGSEPMKHGVPIANTQFYLLDAYLQPVPIGVVGELYIGGAGLATEYWKQPGLTLERFFPNPFAAGRIYRTGDLGRWHVDASGQGQVELLGRTDFQVKMRGYRIELGEIEAAIMRHPSIRNAVVLGYGRDETVGVASLVAYVEVGQKGMPVENVAPALRNFLKEELPDYMIPGLIVPLAQFPLTPNGKLDRKGLPDPSTLILARDETSHSSFLPPANEIEKKLAQIWSEVLTVNPISVGDSIFELGGDSLLIFRIAARCQREGLSVTAAGIFRQRTIAGLAASLSGQKQVISRVTSAPARIGAAPRKTYRGGDLVRG